MLITASEPSTTGFDRRLVPHVGVNRGDLPSPAALCKERGALRTTHRDANVGAVVGQTLHDLAPHKSGTAEDGDTVVGHVRFPADAEADYLTVSEEAHRWRRLLDAGTYRAAGELAEAESVTRSFVNRLLRLTLLAPDIVEVILEGRQPKGTHPARAAAEAG